MGARRRVAVGVCGVLLASLLGVAGSSTPAGAAAPILQTSWAASGASGIAVSASGFVYVVDGGGNRVQRFDLDGNYLSQFGSGGSANGQFSAPTGIAVAADGSLYVADTGNNRIQKFDAGGTFVAKWGTAGTGSGQFNAPQGVALDPSGNVYVTDTGNNRVQKFTSAGVYRTKWGILGTGSGRFDAPAGIAVSADRKVYVVDAGNRRVQQFTGTGAYQRQWGRQGSGPSRFSSPWGVAVDAAGSVYVADLFNSRIQQFSPTGAFGWETNVAGAFGVAIGPDGTSLFTAYNGSRVARFGQGIDPPAYLDTWGSQGGGDGQFQFPYGVAVDATSGSVYVVDSTLNRVQKFTSAGVYVSQWGATGSANGQFNSPSQVAVDATGNVYVVDTGNDRVQKFTSAGVFVAKWGVTGTGNGQFNAPVGVAVGPDGGVYVTDLNNSRVQKFTAAGAYLSQWGTFGSGNGQFSDPEGVAVDAAGNVYVTDGGGNGRVQKFTSTGTYVTQWRQGLYGGDLDHPHSVAVDSSGNVFVTDSGASMLLEFTSTGSLVVAWREFGASEEVAYPYSVAPGPSGLLYVADTGYFRVHRFTTAPLTSPVVSLSADQSSVSPGEAIDYHLTITNATAAALTGVAITDPRAPDCEAAVGDLAASASVTVDCSYNTGADDAGPYANTATVDSDQTAAITSNVVTTQVGPAVTVSMSAPATVVATGSINYVLSITNNTALPLSGVRVTDSVAPGCAGPVADIAAGATATVNCARATVDADAGSTVVNVATVDSTATQAASAVAVTRVQGRVTGTVTGPGGPLAGVYVVALDRDFLPLHGDAVTNASGQFTMGLDPGRYFFAFLDSTGLHAAEYSSSKTSATALTSADLTMVPAGSGPTSYNAALLSSGFSTPVNPGSISGTVTDANGPVAGVWVVAVNGGVRSVVRTNGSGQYTVGGLPAGSTFLEFVDPAGAHQIRWYLNDSGGNPTVISLSAGQNRTGFNQQLPAYP